MGVDELGVDEMGVDEIGSRRSGNKPIILISHVILNKNLVAEFAMGRVCTGRVCHGPSLLWAEMSSYRLNDELESVQKRAARFVTRNYNYETGSMTGILEESIWETLQKRRKDNRLILLYKGLKGKARIPTDDLIPKNRRCRNQHSLVFQIPTASKDAYQKSFFPQTIRDWNVLPDSLISSAELSDDCVSKFTSLVRARD